MDVFTMTEFLGYCTFINVSILLFSTLMLTVFRSPAMAIHSLITGVKEERLPLSYFNYLAMYKILIIVFNLVPYIALKFVLVN